MGRRKLDGTERLEEQESLVIQFSTIENAMELFTRYWGVSNGIGRMFAIMQNEEFSDLDELQRNSFSFFVMGNNNAVNWFDAFSRNDFQRFVEDSYYLARLDELYQLFANGEMTTAQIAEVVFVIGWAQWQRHQERISS